MNHQLEQTLGNETWLRENEAALRRLFPDTWTHVHNLNILRIGFKLKLLGVDWRSVEEMKTILKYLQKIGAVQVQNIYQIRANPRNIFENNSLFA